MSIRVKILVPMAVVALVCTVIVGLLGVVTSYSFAEEFNDQQLTRAHELASSLLSQYGDDATRASTMAAENEHLIRATDELLSGEDRQPLVDAAISMMNATNVDFLTVMDTQGNVLVRAHEPDNFGDSLAKQANVQTAMQGKQYMTTEKGSAVKLSVRCGTPIFNEENSLIGVVSLGYRLDQSGFVDYIKQMTHTEVTVFLGDTRVSNTILNEKGEPDTDTQTSEEISAQVLAGKDYRGRVNEGGKALFGYYLPIRDAENVVLGMLFVGLDTSSADARMTGNTWVVAGVALLMAVLAIVVAMYISNGIARPIHEMADAARRMADGDLNVEITVAQTGQTKDETLQLAQAFSEMIRANREQAEVIREAADGDLSGDIAPRSEKDIVGIALKSLLDKNNKAFSKMKGAAAQLDFASSQIADGAQNLSQGAVAQANTIERLHAELDDLSGRTAEKVTHAREAASLSEAVKASAEKGSRQMDQMIDAVDQISQASESIGKVMKVIDDIAFQTNILALNAAVEAARAGQHGKGFAVVAEEVRNLAAKSAQAARDTGVLIANSIEKAKLGAQISADTAASFADIVDGINGSSTIVEQIAGFMQTQNSDIASIARGVNEISVVVTSVGASAEQNAASSQEMSSQASVMAMALSGYKLRDQITSLPPGSDYGETDD